MLPIVHPKIRVLVVSSGGAGTTMLIKFLSQYVACNNLHDSDSLKHSPLPPLSFNPKLKVIYLVGDPVESVGSLFRRGYQYKAFSKFTRFSKKKVNAGVLADIHLYAQSQSDVLMLERHFRNWTSQFQFYQTFIIKYEDLWDKLADLLDFLELPREIGVRFPKQRPRQTIMSGDPQNDQLRECYQDLILSINNLDRPTIKGFRLNAFIKYHVSAIPALAVASPRNGIRLASRLLHKMIQRLS